MKDAGRTGSAWLVNDRGDYTLHDYHGTEVVRYVGEHGEGEDAVALLFRCRETRAVRRWGLETMGQHGLAGPSVMRRGVGDA